MTILIGLLMISFVLAGLRIHKLQNIRKMDPPAAANRAVIWYQQLMKSDPSTQIVQMQKWQSFILSLKVTNGPKKFK